jgi:hypothetical protein
VPQVGGGARIFLETSDLVRAVLQGAVVPRTADPVRKWESDVTISKRDDAA